MKAPNLYHGISLTTGSNRPMCSVKYTYLLREMHLFRMCNLHVHWVKWIFSLRLIAFRCQSMQPPPRHTPASFPPMGASVRCCNVVCCANDRSKRLTVSCRQMWARLAKPSKQGKLWLLSFLIVAKRPDKDGLDDPLPALKSNKHWFRSRLDDF